MSLIQRSYVVLPDTSLINRASTRRAAACWSEDCHQSCRCDWSGFRRLIVYMAVKKDTSIWCNLVLCALSVRFFLGGLVGGGGGGGAL